MNKNSNLYTFFYAVIMVVVVAVGLTCTAVLLQPRRERNVQTEKQRNILAAIHVAADAERADSLFNVHIINMYATNSSGDVLSDVNPFSLNIADELKAAVSERQLPVYECVTPSGKKFVFELYGKGLWGPIWGYIAFEADFSSVYGVYFDHKGETPGLGAEIATQKFQDRFKDKSMFNADGFCSIKVQKHPANDDVNAVDAISGGTITSKGVETMLHTCLEAYLPFVRKCQN